MITKIKETRITKLLPDPVSKEILLGNILFDINSPGWQTLCNKIGESNDSVAVYILRHASQHGIFLFQSSSKVNFKAT